jgi:hypothetical protein
VRVGRVACATKFTRRSPASRSCAAFVRIILSAALVGVGVSGATATAGASCVTGTVPTTQYMGTVVDRIADQGGVSEQYKLRLDDGRIILVQIARRGVEDGYAGALPQVGHRYRVRGAASEEGTSASLGLSACVPSAQLVDLGVASKPSHSRTGPIAALAIISAALLGAAVLIVARRGEGRAQSKGA